MKALLKCTKCFEVLPLSVCNSEEFVECFWCASKTKALVFPALLSSLEAVSAESIEDESESSCFYHPAKKATVACESCGRFICSLCEVELSGARLCPQCLDSGKRKGKLTSLETTRTLYDNRALAFSLTGILVLTFPTTIVTAPLAFYNCLRYRNAPRSLVRPGRWKWWTALVLSSLQIIGWVVFLITYFTASPIVSQTSTHQKPISHPTTLSRKVK